MPTARYHEIRARLKTGDIVLFSGKSNTSDLIKRFTFSRWSHVGMILRLPEHNGPLCWESLRISELADVEDGKIKSGVQLLDMDLRVRHCPDPIAIRLLSKTITAEMHAATVALHEEVRDRPYEQNLSELVRSAYDGPFGQNEEDLSSLFCSELLAEAYQRMGLLLCDTKGGEASNEYTPAFFSGDNTKPLLKGYSLGPEHIINPHIEFG